MSFQVKHLSLSRALAAVLVPLLITLSVAFVPIGCGSSSSSPTPTPSPGAVVVGFTDSPSQGFQNLLLNVVALRMNPSANLSLSEGDPNWVSIAVPPGLGSSGELQIDLNKLQGQAVLFNTANVAAQIYNQVELQLDPNFPATLIPNCPNTGALEGCISYSAVFANPGVLRFGAVVNVTQNGLTPVVLDVALNCSPGALSGCTPPVAPGGFYTISPSVTISAAPNLLLGQVSGTIPSAPTASGFPVLAVTAEVSGTNQFVSTVNPQFNGNFVLDLPAVPGGTKYDLFVSGGGSTYAALQGVTVTPNETTTVPPFNITTGQTIGALSGQILNSVGVPIQAATLQLLAPSGVVASPGAFCAANPSSCVVVASATTDNSGNFPNPGSVRFPSQFATIPAGNYGLTVNASGFDQVISEAVVVNPTNFLCTGSFIPTNHCFFGLTNTTISGSVSVDVPPPPGNDVVVLVTAENTGTNALQGVTMTQIPAGLTSAPFTINVPTKAAGVFDLVATSQDLFNGVPDPFAYHTFGVLSGVPAGATGANISTLDCTGHGSLGGLAALGFDSGTTMLLSKMSATSPVAITQSNLGITGTTNAGQFSFCAPADTYIVSRLENGAPTGSSTTIAIPTPSPTPPPVPSPGATPSPCPLCAGSAVCPGTCNNVIIPNPL